MALGIDWRGAKAADGDIEMDPWLVIGADDSVTLRLTKIDGGQGAQTMMVAFICEELNCDPKKVKTEYIDLRR